MKSKKSSNPGLPGNPTMVPFQEDMETRVLSDCSEVSESLGERISRGEEKNKKGISYN